MTLLQDHAATSQEVHINQAELGALLKQKLLKSTSLSSGYELRDPQLETALAAANALSEERGSGLFVRPARTGKTVIFGAIAKNLDLPTLILVPKKGLANQTKKSLASVVGIDPKEIGVYHSGKTYADDGKWELTANASNPDNLKKKYLVTTYDSYRNLIKPQGNDPARISPTQFPLVILDEVHKAQGEVTVPIVKDLRRRGCIVQGWTATDVMADGTNVSDSLFDGAAAIDRRYFNDCVQKTEELAPTRNLILQSKLQTRIIPSGDDDFTQKQAEEISKIKGRDEAVVKKLFHFKDTEVTRNGAPRSFKDMPQIWYCAGLTHASHVVDLLNAEYEASDAKEEGVTYAKRVDGEMSDEEREAVFADFKAGKVKALISADLLIEGYDFPWCEATVMLRPTKSPRIAVQAGARSTSLNPDDKEKVAYIINVVDQDAANYAVFADAANGMWVAPDHIWKQYGDVGKHQLDPKVDTTDLPGFLTICNEKEWIDFKTARQNGAAISDLSKMPPGFMQYKDIFKHYPGYVNFRSQIYSLFHDLERQYLNHQGPHDPTTPFMSSQRIPIVMLDNIMGGKSLCFDAAAMHKFINKIIMPEKPLGELQRGYIFLPDLIKSYYVPIEKRSAVEKFESATNSHYYDAERAKFLTQRYQQPVTMPQGFNAIKARTGRTHILSVEETPARAAIEKDLQLVRKAPKKLIGFVGPVELAGWLRQNRYLTQNADSDKLFAGLQSEFDAQTKSDPDSRYRPVALKTSGIEVALCHSPSGKNQLTARLLADPDHGITGLADYAVKKLGLIQQGDLLRKPPQKYRTLDQVKQTLSMHFADAPEKIDLLESYVEGRYDKAYAAQTALAKKDPALFPDKADSIERAKKMMDRDTAPALPINLSKATQLPDLKLSPDPKQNELRIVRAGVGGIRNATMIHEDDVNKLPTLLNLKQRYMEPPSHGYSSYGDAIERLQDMKLDARENFHFILNYMENEYEEAQKKLPWNERYQQPFKTSDGITVMRCHIPGQSNVMFYNTEELALHAPEMLGVKSTREAGAAAARASHVDRAMARMGGVGSGHARGGSSDDKK